MRNKLKAKQVVGVPVFQDSGSLLAFCSGCGNCAGITSLPAVQEYQKLTKICHSRKLMLLWVKAFPKGGAEDQDNQTSTYIETIAGL